MNQELWDMTIEKHGHTCPGVAYGYRIGCEVLRIFGEDEDLRCVTSLHNCVTDGVCITTGLSLEDHTMIFDDTVEGFIFFTIDDDEGWQFTLKKLEYAEQADPVMMIQAVNRDKLFTIEPCDAPLLKT